MSHNTKEFNNNSIVSCLLTDKTTNEQMSSEFTCNDVAINYTIMMGVTTSGKKAIGVVKRIIPGVCFEIEQNTSQISMLWSDLMINPVTAKKHIKNYVEPSIEPVIIKYDSTGIPLPPSEALKLRRTDSGADYGYYGYPDCDFWSKEGITPLFVATDSDYSNYRIPKPPTKMREILLECKENAEKQGGEYLKAWQRQMDAINSLFI